MPSRRRADALIRDVIRGQALQAPDNKPFHLVVNVRYTYAGATAVGKYELLWAAADRFRENFRMDDAVETDMALGKKIYIFRNTPTLTPQFLHVRNLVKNPLELFLGLGFRVDQIYFGGTAGQASDCIALSKNQKDTVCLDPTTDAPSAVHFHRGSASTPFSLEEHDFLNVGALQYPRQITEDNGEEAIQIEVETLEKVTAFAPEVFQPVAKSVVRDWCPRPKLGYSFTSLPFPRTNPVGLYYPFYLLTGTDGHIKKFIPLRSSTPPISPAVAKWIREAQFPIFVCGSVPLEDEQLFMYPFRITKLYQIQGDR